MSTDDKMRNLIVKSLSDRRRRNIDQNAGFTLLELLSVVLIVAILSAIIAPNWLGFVNRQRLNKANEAVLSAIKQAQTQAKNTKNSYSVSFRVNTSTNIPEYIIYQGTPTTTNPSSGWNTSSSGWMTLGDNLGIQPRQVFLYTNLTSLTSPTAYNTTAASNVVTTTTGSGTITFDHLGALANKISNNSADTPLKIMVSTPQGTGSTASSLQRCVILQGLIGGMQIKQDTDCQ